MRKLTKTAITVATMATMVLGTVASINADEQKTGWVGSGTNYEYYNDKGDKQTNTWVESNGNWYFLDSEGKMAVNSFIRTDSFTKDSEVLSERGVNDELGIDDIDDDASFYYVNDKGEMVTGWQEIATNRVYLSPNSELGRSIYYYFGTSGAMYTNAWIKAGEDWYAVGQNGQMMKNSFAAGNLKEEVANDDQYYLDSNGKMIRGWYKTTNADKDVFGKKDLYIYADTNGALAKNEWVKDGSKWYFIGTGADNDANDDDDNNLDIVVYNNYMKSNGTLDYDEYDAAVEGIKEEAYVMLSDKLVKWTNHSNDKRWFWLQDNGDMLTGWNEFDDDYYVYANNSGELERNGVKKINNKYYYFNSNAVCDYKTLNTLADYAIEYEVVSGDSKVKEYLFYDIDSKDNSKTAGNNIVNITLNEIKENLDSNSYYTFGTRAVQVKSMTDLQLILAYAASNNQLQGSELTVYRLRNSTTTTATVSIQGQGTDSTYATTTLTAAPVTKASTRSIANVTTGSSVTPTAATTNSGARNTYTVSFGAGAGIGKGNIVGAELVLENTLTDATIEVKLLSVPTGAKVSKTLAKIGDSEIKTGKYLTLEEGKSTLYVDKAGRYVFTVTTKEKNKNAVTKTVVVELP